MTALKWKVKCAAIYFQLVQSFFSNWQVIGMIHRFLSGSLLFVDLEAKKSPYITSLSAVWRQKQLATQTSDAFLLVTPQLEFSHAGPVVSFPPPRLRLILPWSPSSCLPMLTCSCHLCTLTPELCHTARGFAVCCSPRQPPIDGVILDQRTTSPSFLVAALQRLHVVHITSGYGSLQNEKQPRNRQDCETRSSACKDPKRVLFFFF